MPQRILCLIRTRKPDLKSRWAERLRAQPVRTAMAEPAILSYLMDETLEQLTAQLTRRAPVRSGRVQALDKLCRCGLNPLIAYFGMGELSLLDLLAEEAGEGKPLRALVCDHWGRLAEREIDALCGACVRPCASSARKPRTKAAFVRPGVAVAPAARSGVRRH